MGASSQSRAVVKDYLRLPDRRQSGCGMTAGGSLSPLLAAVMLIPLDEAMNRLFRRYGLSYVRYMDDFVILAQKPHQLRRAIKRVHEVLGRIGLHLHGRRRLLERRRESPRLLRHSRRHSLLARRRNRPTRSRLWLLRSRRPYPRAAPPAQRQALRLYSPPTVFR